MREFTTDEILEAHVDRERLDLYLSEVERANARFSLYSRNLRRDDLLSLVADCLIVKELDLIGESSGKIIDIGSGWGLPAIPLLLADETLAVTLAERSQKKADFLALMLHKLKLKATIHTGDIKTLDPEAKYDTIISRRVALDGKLIKQIRSHASDKAVFVYYGTAFPQSAFGLAETIEYTLDTSPVRTIIKSDIK